MVNERMTGLEVVLQQMIFNIQATDGLGKEKKVHLGARRQVLEFLQVRQT